MAESPDHLSIMDAGTDSALDDLIEVVTARLQAGEAVDVDELARCYPEYAERLGRLIPALAMMADLGHSSVIEVAGVPAQETPPDVGRHILGDFRILRE